MSMNKSKKIISVLAAATLAVSAFAFSACGGKKYQGETFSKDTSAILSSTNGGFVVESGEYVYFINGSESNTASNKYGDAVKGSLMRIAKTDLASGNYSNAKIVVPSLFVTGNYDSGVYIYGDKVYYATPTTDKNNAGQVENSYLDFKWAKLDGSEAPMGGKNDYFLRLSSNTTKYRFVEVEGVVYCMYEESSQLKSYNLSTGKTTVLVKGAGSFFYNKSDLTDPNVYYTMDVKYDLDKTTPTTATYNQIYCVNAAATATVDAAEASYKVFNGDKQIAEYDFDQDFLKEDANDAGYDLKDYTTYPYVNLGQLVLDGVGSTLSPSAQNDQRFNVDKDSISGASKPLGYKYTIQQHTNDGIYFTRTAGTDDAEASYLYYVSTEKATADAWNTITDNKNVDVVAQETTNASASAVFTIDNGVHKYLYLSGSVLYRAEAGANGVATNVVELTRKNVESNTLWTVSGDYLYFYGSGTNGKNLSRINYKGGADKYGMLKADEEYQPQTLPMVDWYDSWYKPEFVDVNGTQMLMYANAQSYGNGGKAYNYIYGTKVPTTAEIIKTEEDIEKVNEYIDGYSENSELQDAMNCYFRTGSDAIYDAVLAENADNYDEYQKTEYTAFTAKFAAGGEFENILENKYIGLIGRMTDDDVEEIETSWKDMLLTDDEDDEDEESGLPTWAIVLIVCGSVLVVAAAVVVPTVIVLNKKKAQKRKEEAIVSAYKHKKIDTTDDKTIDVYADSNAEESSTEEENQAEEVSEATEEAPVEETPEGSNQD